MSRKKNFGGFTGLASRGIEKRRRGATLVLIAIVMTVLVMFGGIGIDFARMYSFNSQLKVLADAASLAAAVELRKGGTEADGDARAIALRPSNTVDGGQLATMAATDVTPGQWNPATRVFTPGAWVGANAVQATTSYVANWTLAKIFGATNKTLMQQSVAAVGAQRASGCLKPFGFSYSSLRTAAGAQDPNNLTDSLTAADIARLVNPTRTDTFNLNASTPANIPGNFGFVEFPPVSGEQNKNEYLGSVIEPGCAASPAGVGDTIPGINGNMSADVIKDAMRALCVGANNQLKGTCVPAPRIEVPIFDLVLPDPGRINAGGSGVNYRIRYIGAFELIGMDFHKENILIGRFVSIGGQSSGGFTPFSGPVTTTALVK